MNLLGLFARRPTGEKLSNWARCVAARCRDAVWRRVAARAGEFGPCQWEGYVRSRAVVVVRREVNRFLEDAQTNSADVRLQLIALSLDAVYSVIARPEPALAPARIARRRAA